ncbi:hypothetical protein H4S02_001139, partial [Coemansia sp. RSA 2611]
MLRDELGVQEESAAAIMQDIHALRQQWKMEPAGFENIEMDSVACYTPADSIGYDSSSESDGGTIARLIVKLGARPPERVVARRVPLVSTEYLGMVPSSDSEPGEPDTQRGTSDRGSLPYMPDSDSNMMPADSDTDNVDSDIPLAELLADSGSDYPDSDAPLASTGLLEGMRNMGIASAAVSPRQTSEGLSKPAQHSTSPKPTLPATDSSEDRSMEAASATAEKSVEAATVVEGTACTEADVPPRPRRRIAPTLVTSELSENPSGNIVDQCALDKVGDNLGPPAPTMP